MKTNPKKLFHAILIFLLFYQIHYGFSQITTVGNGSYTATFPGTDEAGRNDFPPGTPQLVGSAIGKPVPTNDWWSKLIQEDHADNLFNYPMTLKTTNSGLVVSYIPWGVINDQEPIVVGVSGLSASRTNIGDYTDWTVTMDWSEEFQATSGIGMPFLYFNKSGGELAEIKVNNGSATIMNEMILITDASHGADFAIYAPTGSTWDQSGTTYTSSLNGQNYWSMAMLPQEASDPESIATEYKKYAYVFPSNTTVLWSYDENTSVMRTDFTVETDIKEGTESEPLLGLLPHQWDNLAQDSEQPEQYSYTSVRGELKTISSPSFSVENTYYGILPTLPYVSNYSEGFSPAAQNEKVEMLQNDGLSTWTDSYNEGQMMNRLIQAARIAHEMGNIESRDKMIATIKERLEDWLSAESSEVAFLFYYNADWSALLGYPAGHGQDNNINDHHFHWGYFIHAASFIQQFEPGWVSEWGEMVNHLVRDAASSDRTDDLFPFLRNFSPYAGHCWANGFASFPQGNDQESTSESMQFNSALIHWGTITGNDEIRDLGIYLYTTEQSAIEEYWFDVNERNFLSSQPYKLVSRVWGNSYDNGTFWTNDIEASYGIELYPIHGGSMYLGHNKDYSESLWAEIENNTGILNNESHDNLWHDTMWKYLAFTDPQKAIDLYDGYSDRNLKFGVSDAQTYYWLHSMNALGKLDATITADYPIAVAFKKGEEYTYAAHNYADSPISVTFSNGFVLEVPANTMATNRDVDITGELTVSFSSAFPGGSIVLSMETESENISKVAFFEDGNLLEELTEEPYTIKVEQLVAGTYDFYARIYEGDDFGVSTIVPVIVGNQQPYNGNTNVIPGTIEAGNYDVFEGGSGQGISYLDVSSNNEGDYRQDEAVDAAFSDTEGATIGWIAAGEWLEYTVNVEASGYYELSFRHASDNQNGGGPFHLELDDVVISEDIDIQYTGGWDEWESKTVSSLAMPEGKHVLKVVFEQGEFNIGAMTFTFQEELPYGPPLADAGENVVVILPETTATLDGSNSSDSDTESLQYLWEQINGPSVIAFSDVTAISPTISNLEEGIYTCQLTVSDEARSSTGTVLVIVSETGNSSPSVAITSPTSNDTFREGEIIEISASASDLEGELSLVEFYDGETKIGEDSTAPYSIQFTDASIGSHELQATATDADDATTTSQPVNISVEEIKTCIKTGTTATEGSFSVGYNATFEAVGSEVTVRFQLLDNDKTGVVAFLRDAADMSEVQMEQVSENTFETTLNGLTVGSIVSYACKFAYSGGLAVTEYFDYEVGFDCEAEGTNDEISPTDFTASIIGTSESAVEFELFSNEESGTVVYSVTYGSTTELVSTSAGAAYVFTINRLESETTYDFEISTSDLTGNQAANNPILLSASTTGSYNTDCAGTAFEAQLGSFDIGYDYEFETNGSTVTMTFTLNDEKSDVFAFLWKESPFTETAMDRVSGQTFSTSVANLTAGTTVSYACKFEFAGGLAVTKYFTYEIGDNCQDVVLDAEARLPDNLVVYPNPFKEQLTIDWEEFQSVDVISMAGGVLVRSTHNEVQLRNLVRGMYVLLLTSLDGLQYQVRIMKE